MNCTEYAKELLKVINDLHNYTGDELIKMVDQVEFYLEVFLQLLPED
tara:strand:- start:949 stop:1089 length:141 start_codon:yes stop_codon:yes gene_type:complete